MKKKSTLKHRLRTNFLLTALMPVLIFAVMSQFNIQHSIKSNLNDRIENNMENANKNLEMVLDKYETILYDLCTDEDVITNVESLNRDDDILEVNSSSLRRRLSHICNQYTGIVGITIQLKNGEILFYDSLSSSSMNSTWADQVRIPEIERGAVYFGDGEPVTVNGEDHHMFYIARRLIDYRNIASSQGTIVFSINEERIRDAIASDVGSSTYLLSGKTIVSAPDPEQIGKKITDIEDLRKNKYITIDNAISGFSICNEQPLEHYWWISFSQWIFLSMIIVMTVVIMVALLHFASHPYIRAVESITTVMNCVEHGDFRHQVHVDPHLPAEIQQISSGFNEMVGHLEEMIARVKQAVVDQKNAELSALEAQIDPHFLYNTLDTINWKAIENEQYEISGMLGALADILRYTVRNAGGTASMSQEIVWLQQYMMLQSMKCGKRLDVRISLPEEVRNCQIHKLLLQPFVENAIKYAFEGQEKECILNIRMKKSGEQIHILIQDNGRGISPELTERLNREEDVLEGHLGIANVRKRLKLYYGGQATLYFESEVGNYTKVHLFIPIEEETTCVL